ncbi:MAG TPA: DUF4193 family protein [Actinomycetota bacterium]|nr:DUF4193 family protein [Actinomycetota bacterium]
MEDNIDEMTEDEDLEPLDDEGDEEEGAPEPAATTTDGEGGAEVESSLEELLAKREGGKPAEEEDEDDSMLAIGRDERLEPLAVKVVPPTDKEFVCKNCHLVKHRSQLADRDRMFCRDCA